MSRTARIAALVAVPVLVTGGCLAPMMLFSPDQASASACGPSQPGVSATTGIPAGPVAGYSGEQLQVAAAVINAGRDLGVSLRGQTVGVMTAMGESSLIEVDHGDTVGPDSRGPFQQRPSWGSLADRMDAYASARLFFRALLAVPGWEELPPTIAAHRVQRNADPYHYERFWDPAVQVVEVLSGSDVAGVQPGTGDLVCTGATPGGVAADGWIKPANGPVTSPFGMRTNPVTGVYRLHSGTDIGAACDTPVLAANAGVVVQAGAASGYGNLITIDHGHGTVTRYGHEYDSGVLVHVGQKVTAGQQIGKVGSFGNSTGCHLHFEVRLNNDFTDPEPFMSQHGARL